MLLAYQSDSQVKAAFKDKPTLLYDNCTTQIYLGGQQYRNGGDGSPRVWVNGRRCSKAIGENTSRSWNEGGYGGQGQQANRGRTLIIPSPDGIFSSRMKS